MNYCTTVHLAFGAERGQKGGLSAKAFGPFGNLPSRMVKPFGSFRQAFGSNRATFRPFGNPLRGAESAGSPKIVKR